MKLFKNITSSLNRELFHPFKDVVINRNISKTDVLNNGNSNLYRMLFSWSLLVLFVLMPVMSFDFGIAADEDVHYKHGHYVVDYFLKGDKKCLNQPKTNLHYYGQSFDNITAFFVRVFDIDNAFEFRHFLNSITGWLGVLICGLLVLLLSGSYRVAFISIVLLVISPRYMYHSMVNHKDLPFALAYVSSIYFMFRYFRDVNKNTRTNLVLLTLSIGAAISIRAGGYLLIAYLWMYLGLYYLQTNTIKGIFKRKNIISLGKPIYVLISVSLFAYVIGLLVWPYALQNPAQNPFKALKVLTNYTVSIRQLFDGQNVFSNKLPWHYASRYILITTPLIVLFGVGTYFVISVIKIKKFTIEKFFLLFSIIFPLVYIVIKNSNLYGGMRHVLFIYIPMVVVASVGLKYLYEIIKPLVAKKLLVIFILFLSVLPASWMFRNYPHYLPYFNEIQGGVKGAYGKYELDYWFTSFKQATEWLIENEGLKNSDKKVIVAGNQTHSLKYYSRHCDSVQIKYTRYYNKSRYDWDYAVYVNSYINVDQLKKRYYPIKGTIKEIKVDGRPICIVVKRPSKEDYYGYKAMKKGKYNEALTHFSNYLKINPDNEEVLNYVSLIFLNAGKFNEAEAYARRSLAKCDKFSSAMVTLGKIHYSKKEYKKSLAVFAEVLREKNTFWGGYYFMALNFYKLKKNDEAIKYASFLVRNKKNMAEPYQLLALVYKEKGNEKAYKNYMNKFLKLKGQKPLK